ncbi:unnamed protein product, partial [marine sediment metagenome]
MEHWLEHMPQALATHVSSGCEALPLARVKAPLFDARSAEVSGNHGSSIQGAMSIRQSGR